MPAKKAKKDEPYSEILDITPQMAINWLDAVPDYQRKIDDKHVNKLVMAIQRKEWRLNGAAIVFNEKGELIDGQHRLHAIYKSGQTIQSLVVTGISKDELAFASLGDTKPRRVTDFIYTKDVTIVASVLRLLWFLENRLLFYGIRGKGMDMGGSQRTLPTNPPVAEIVRLGRKHANAIAELVAPLYEARKATRCGSFIVFIMYYFQVYRSKDEAAKVAEFFARVGDGVGLDAHSPMLQLRKRCQEPIGNLRLPMVAIRALTVKALNFHLNGQKIDKLLWTPSREPFPALPGYDSTHELKATNTSAENTTKGEQPLNANSKEKSRSDHAESAKTAIPAATRGR